MKNLTTYLIAAAALVLPFAAYAQSADATYCAALSARYRAFAAANQANDIATVAMAKCAAGDTASGIPVLEKILTDNKIDLPKR